MNAQIAQREGMIHAPQNLTLDAANSIVITDKILPEVEGTIQLVNTNFFKAAELVVGQFEAPIHIQTSAENTYWAIQCAIKHDIEVYEEGQLIEIRKDDGKLKPARDLAEIKSLGANTNKQYQGEFKYLLDSGLKKVPSKTSIDELRAELMANAEAKKGFKLILPNFKYAEASEAVDAILDAAIEKRAAYVSSFHTIGADNPHATHLEVQDHAELRQMVTDAYDKGEKLVIVLNGNMAEGKTRNVIDPLFGHFCTAGAYPLSVSARRSQAARFEKKKDIRHYWTAINDLHNVPGVVGVSNTVFHDHFSPLTSKSKALFIDEIEEERSHRAIGNGSIDACAAYNQRKEQQMQQSQIVIVADANATDQTVNWLNKVTGQQVIVASKKAEPQYFNVNYFGSKDQMGAEITAQLQAGRNVAVFCDAKKESVYDLMAGFEKEIEGLKCKLIDAAFAETQEGRDMLADMDEASKEYQLLIITPVINSGVSIQNGHFDSVFVIAAHTVLPTAIMQSMRRFRDVMEINLCFWKRAGKRSTDAGEIMWRALSKERRHQEFSLDVVNGKMDEPYARKVVDRIAWENRMREDYDNTLLIMLEQQGFNINRIGACEEKRKDGANTAAKGRRKEQKFRNEFLINAPVITSEDIKVIRDKRSAVTREQALLMKAHDIRSGLGVTKITEDDIKFEDANGCALVNNIIMARADVEDYRGDKSAFKVALLKKVFKILNIDPEDWSGRYSNYNGVQLREFIYGGEVTITTTYVCKDTGEVKENHNTLPARTVFSIAFGEAVDPTKGPIIVIKDILAQFGLKHESTGDQITEPNKKRNFQYVIVKTEKFEKAEMYSWFVTGKVCSINAKDSMVSITGRMKAESIIDRPDHQALSDDEQAEFIVDAVEPKPEVIPAAEPELTADQIATLSADPNYQSLVTV